MLHTQRGAIYPLRKVRSFNMCSKMMEILYQLIVASTVHTLLWCALALVTPIDWRKILGKLALWLAPKWILLNLWCRGAHWTNCYPSLVYPDFFIMSVTVTNCFHPQLNDFLCYFILFICMHLTYFIQHTAAGFYKPKSIFCVAVSSQLWAISINHAALSLIDVSMLSCTQLTWHIQPPASCKGKQRMIK